MAYNILALKNDLSGAIHGTTNNQITNLDGVINRAARKLLLDLDPQETKRTLQFGSPLYDSVFDYAIAPDVKGNKIIDIIPQVNRIPRDVWMQSYNQAFDVLKQNLFAQANMFTMNFDTGLKSIRINAPFLNAPVVINQCSDTQQNGTWTVGGTASSLEVNNQNYVQGGGSLQFNLTAGTGYLENSTMSAVDLSEVEDQASLFVNTFFRDGSATTAVSLRFGSSASNYWEKTVTLNQQGFSFQDGWNQEQFVWSEATATGSPDASSISYIRVSIGTSASQAGCLLNGINSILGTFMSYEYYSKYLFRDATTGEFQETVTDDSNLINLDTESYNLLFNLVAYFATQQQQGKDALQYDGKFFLQEYTDGLKRYKAMYLSEVQKPQTTYYAQPMKGYNNLFGNFNNG